MLDIYTDGACSGNPGPGGWGYVVLKNGEVIEERSGGESDTTNNRMELTAVIKALEDRDEPVTIYTDSQYVKNGITVWIHAWVKKNWMTSANKPVKNKDLWQALHSLAQNRAVSWEWVKGHSGDQYNEHANLLATKAVCKATLF